MTLLGSMRIWLPNALPTYAPAEKSLPLSIKHLIGFYLPYKQAREKIHQWGLSQEILIAHTLSLSLIGGPAVKFKLVTFAKCI